MKRCSRCKLSKDEGEFYTKHTACKRCVLFGQKKKYHNDAEFRSRVIVASSIWHKENPEKCRDSSLKQRHGITRQQYDMMLESQEGVCAICERPETKKLYGKVCRLHVDHDHETGIIRGLLCHQCNVALGNFKEDVLVIQKAITYLRKVSDGKQQAITGGQVHP